MPHRQISETKNTLTVLQSILETHRSTRDRLAAKRAEAVTAEEIARLNNQITVNRRTLESVQNAVESLARHVKQLEHAEANVTAGGKTEHGETPEA